MRKEKGVLFGIDGSDFSRQALLEIGGLLKNSKDLKVTLFHGAADPSIPFLCKLISQGLDAAEKHRELWILEAEKILEQAREALKESGFDPHMVSTILEKGCSEPAGAMLKFTGTEGIETVAVGRWGKTTVSRQVIGSVTFKLSHLASNVTVWVVEPRISSHDVLVGLVGAPISQRVVDYTVRYFGHLRESRFTFIHVIPRVPPQCWNSEGIVEMAAFEDPQKLVSCLKEYTDRVKEIANDAKKKLIKAGVPEQNVFFKFQPQKSGIARDILEELHEGNHGILVVGRKGFRDIKEFGLGSKANKLLITARAFIVCLVN